MKKLKIKADKKFIQLYDQSENIKQELLEKLSKSSGYANMWVSANFEKAIKLAKKEDMPQINELIRKINATRNYVWSKFFYDNINKIPAEALNPYYDPKTHEIVFPNINIIKQVIDNLGKMFKGLGKNKGKD